jgi:hypothetical protein
LLPRVRRFGVLDFNQNCFACPGIAQLLEIGSMRHPALRRSARHSLKREAKNNGGFAAQSPSRTDPSAQNRAAPGSPADGEHNQGGARAEGLDYQRDLGSEQDA